MPDSHQSLKSLLQYLRRDELLTDEGEGRIHEFLALQAASPVMPWYVKALVAIGAWIAAICFVVFLGIAELISDDKMSYYLFGGLFIVASLMLHRKKNSLFLTQLALALSMAGHIMILISTDRDSDSHGAVALVMTGLCLVLYPCYRDFLHRFLSVVAAPALILVWLVQADYHHALHGVLAVQAVAAALLFICCQGLKNVHAAAYGLATSLPFSLLLVFAPHEEIDTPWWPSSVILGCGLAGLCIWAGRITLGTRREPVVLAAIGSLALGALPAPGLPVALGLMVLGYGLRNLYLSVLGMAFCPVYLIVFYFDLDVDLLDKSWILAGSGLLLLVSRWIVKARPWAREAGA